MAPDRTMRTMWSCRHPVPRRVRNASRFIAIRGTLSPWPVRRERSGRLKGTSIRRKAFVIPTGPPEVIEIVYIDADGERTPGPVFELQSAPAGQTGSWGVGCGSASNAESKYDVGRRLRRLERTPVTPGRGAERDPGSGIASYQRRGPRAGSCVRLARGAVLELHAVGANCDRAIS